MVWKLTCAALFALVLSSSLSGPAEPGELTAEDRAAIAAVGEAWAAAANAGDFDALAKLYDEDAILLPPGAEAVRGRAAIGAYFRAFPPFADMRLEHLEVVGRGDLAYVRGGYSMKISIPGAGEPLAERGKYLEIWRKRADGSWGIARDMFSSDLPVPGAK